MSRSGRNSLVDCVGQLLLSQTHQYEAPDAHSDGNPPVSVVGPLPPAGPASGPRIVTPPITQPTGYTPRSLPGRTTVPTKTFTESTVMIGKDVVSPSPKSFSQAVITPTTTTGGQNFMPLVYIGGAGLLLYFLFKK